MGRGRKNKPSNKMGSLTPAHDEMPPLLPTQLRQTQSDKIPSGPNTGLSRHAVPASLSSTDLCEDPMQLVFEFTVDIIDKQYRSYIWNDGKVQALVTIDTGLIAGILLILQIFTGVGVVPFVMLLCSFAFLLVSFLVCLVHAIPIIHSKIGNEENLRTMVGISRLTKDEYYGKVSALDLGTMVKMNCWQIAGMCKNNLRSHNLIRTGVRLTITGVLTIAAALPIVVITDWHRHNGPPAHLQSEVKSVSPVLRAVSPPQKSEDRAPLAPPYSLPRTGEPQSFWDSIVGYK